MIGVRRGPWLILAAAVLWGTTGTAQAFAPVGAQSATIGALRLAVGGAALMALASTRGSLHRGQSWPLLATAVAAGCMAGYQPLFFAGVARTGVAVGTIVAIGSAPILAGGLAFLARGEPLTRRWATATTLAVLGCVLLVFDSQNVSLDGLGILLSLGAGGAYALYALVSKQLLEARPPDAVMAVVFCLAALFLVPLLFAFNLGWVAQMRGLAVVLHLGIVATAAAYALFARGLVVVPVATAVTLSLAEPLTAGLLGVAVLGERLTALTMLGVGLVLSGLVIVTTGARTAKAVTTNGTGGRCS
jgi:DME family drug/metabolite transporter